jgi:16S rRNA (cytosine967-C5)-methyltransferase
VSEVTPARRCAYTVIRRVFEQGAYADRALHAETQKAGLSGRERALATTLAFGTVQRRGTLDHLLAGMVNRSVERLDPDVLAALRLGAYQLLYLDGVADHAAVQQSVELAKRAGKRGGHGLVNAVLRRLAREGPALLAGLDDRTPRDAAVKHSVPAWLAEMWWEQLGEERARSLLAAINEPAENAVRANRLLVTEHELRLALAARGVRAEPAPWPPDCLVVSGRFDAHGSDLWRNGAFTPQSRGAALAGHLLAPQPGERVLDLCAAPGGKTTHIAALMEGRGEVVAVERRPRRAEALRRNVARVRAGNVTVETADARTGTWSGFDRVLVDPPCSNLGTLRSRPDARWRASPQGISEVCAEQARILDVAVRSVGVGGIVLYCTCTISMRENAENIDALLARRDDVVVDDLTAEHPGLAHPAGGPHLQVLPDRDGTEGFFFARLRRTA